MGAHVEISARLAQLMQSAQLVFYDHNWLGGWPVFQFNGFFAHLSTALLSLPVGLFHAEPVLVTSQTLVFLGLVLMPFSVFHASSCLTGHSTPKPLVHSIVLAMFCGSVSVWFLLHSIPNTGVGAGTILVGGDYPQLFAWHLLLLNFGFLARAITAPSDHLHRGRLAFGLVFLVLTQPASGLLFAFYAVFAVFYFQQIRRQLLISYALALGMLAFWLVPSSLLLDGYSVANMSVSDIHLIDLLFGASELAQPLNSQLPDWLAGWDLGAIILLTLTGIWLIFFRATEHTALMPFLVFSGMLSGLFLSFYFASLMPVAVDYQLLAGLVLVLMLPIVAALPAEMLKTTRHHWLAVVSTAALALVISAHKATLPHPLLQRPVATDNYLSEQRVLDYLGGIGRKGRAFIEWPAGEQPADARGQQFIESELPAKAGFEAASGRFFDYAAPYVCAVVPAVSALSGSTDPDYPHRYSGRCNDADPVIGALQARDIKEQLQRLNDLGVSHYIAASEPFTQTLQQAGATLLTRIDQYSILAAAQFNPLHYPPVEPIGYFDFTGNLPARYVSQSLYSDTELPAEITLLQLKLDSLVPEQLSRIIINGVPEQDDERAMRLFKDIQLRNVLTLKFGDKSGDARSPGHYPSANAYLHAELHSQTEFLAPVALAQQQPPPAFSWSDDGQSFSAGSMRENHLLKLSYGHHPYWSARQATFFRAGNGQTYMLPHKADVTATFDNATDIPSQVGMVLTIFTFITLVYSAGMRYPRRSSG